jgi:hypothetical protein
MYKGLSSCLDEGLCCCLTDHKTPEAIQMFSKRTDIVVALTAKNEGGRGLAANASVVMSSSQTSRIQIK